MKRTVIVYDHKKVVIICYTIRRLIRSNIDLKAMEIYQVLPRKGNAGSSYPSRLCLI